MNSDIDQTFGEIHGSADAFLNEVIEIQEHCVISRDKAIHWAHHLRFLEVLTPSNVSKLTDQDRCVQSAAAEGKGSAVGSVMHPVLPSTEPIVLQLTEPSKNPYEV